jgi:hypothetical protein
VVTPRRTVLITAAILATAAATAAFGHAAGLGVNSQHLTVIEGDAEGPPTTPPPPPACPGVLQDGQCTVVLLASADAYVSAASPASNFGPGETLLSDPRAGTNNGRHSFIRFEIPTIPAGGEVKAAELRLHRSSPSASLTYTVQRVATSWTETSITWNNRPGDVLGAPTQEDSGGGSGPVSWDVSDDVTAMVAPQGSNHGWRLTGGGTSPGHNPSTFASRENTVEANRPTLTITYTVPTAP